MYINLQVSIFSKKDVNKKEVMMITVIKAVAVFYFFFIVYPCRYLNFTRHWDMHRHRQAESRMSRYRSSS